MLSDTRQVVDEKNACLHIKTAENDKRVEISIADTGSGISPDVLVKMFEPLFSTKGFGVGLGMPTVKQIMEKHHGGIEARDDLFLRVHHLGVGIGDQSSQSPHRAQLELDTVERGCLHRPQHGPR